MGLLDAAERLLIRTGYAGITTRALAAEARVNHGLVHYYFGSMDNVLAATFDRFTDGLVERQRALYAKGLSFAERWRGATASLVQDRDDQKILLELFAMAWNRPELRERVAAVTAQWRAVVEEALERAKREYGVDDDLFPTKALLALVETTNLGVILERHAGVTEGHRELLDAVDLWLELLEEGRQP